ncbi:MAG: MFS transporter [Pseudonocardiaceae bacterium]
MDDRVVITRHQRRAVVASTVGTAIEFCDFFLYATAAALVFPQLFFPGESALLGGLAAFGTLFVGFAARPVGAVIFGHFGDRLGRKSTLIATLMLMGIGTFLIGCLPTYATIGVAAPVLLTLLRVVQGIGVGGEWGGSVLLSMEWGSPRRHGLMASWPQLGVPIGLLLSTGMVTLMSWATGASFVTWGWRLPFLASLVLVAVGLYVRLRVPETPEFTQLTRHAALVRHPVYEAIRSYPREILTSAVVRISEQAPFNLFITFVLTYGTQHLGLPRDDLLHDTMIAAAIGLVSVPLFGYLSDLIGRRLVYGIGILATGAYAFPYFALLNTKVPGLVLLGIIVSLLCHDLQYGPQGALIAESFATNVRYSGAGLGYQLASVIAGGPAVLIAAAILASTGSSTYISYYILGCAALSLTALVLMPRRPAPTEPAEPSWIRVDSPS